MWPCTSASTPVSAHVAASNSGAISFFRSLRVASASGAPESVLRGAATVEHSSSGTSGASGYEGGRCATKVTPWGSCSCHCRDGGPLLSTRNRPVPSPSGSSTPKI